MEEFNILLEIIKELYNLDSSELTKKSRKRELVELRYVCANILKSETKLTLEFIGENLKLDHSTVSYALREHSSLLESKNSRTYYEKFVKINEAFFKKIQTPERLEIKLKELIEQKNEIENKIKSIKIILKSEKARSSKAEPILAV